MSYSCDAPPAISVPSRRFQYPPKKPPNSQDGSDFAPSLLRTSFTLETNPEKGGASPMAEEHEAQQPYKCAVCGSKFDSQQQLQEHLKSCTKNK
jgi:hypothetical protein